MGNKATRSARLRVLVIVVVVFTGLAAFLWLRTRQTRPFGNDVLTLRYPANSPGSVPTNSASVSNSTTPSPAAESATPVTSPSPSIADLDGTATPSTGNSQPTNPAPLAQSFVGTLKLIIPVVGVRPDQLSDTFAEARSEGRIHDAIDIPAAAGTAVVAAADGEIIKLFQSERGGTTIYQLSADKKFVFYYAHLQRYADGLAAGKSVHQGETIAYVGDTGNAGAGNFHLHFSIALISDPRRYWEGADINPYPLLRK